jgi:hypothetical protein
MILTPVANPEIINLLRGLIAFMVITYKYSNTVFKYFKRRENKIK